MFNLVFCILADVKGTALPVCRPIIMNAYHKDVYCCFVEIKIIVIVIVKSLSLSLTGCGVGVGVGVADVYSSEQSTTVTVRTGYWNYLGGNIRNNTI